MTRAGRLNAAVTLYFDASGGVSVGVWEDECRHLYGESWTELLDVTGKSGKTKSSPEMVTDLVTALEALQPVRLAPGDGSS